MDFPTDFLCVLCVLSGSTVLNLPLAKGQGLMASFKSPITNYKCARLWNTQSANMNLVRSKLLLRLLLIVLAADAAAKGLLMIFGGRWMLLRSFPNIPPSQITSLLLVNRMEAGGLDIGLALMLIAAVREPLRYRTVVMGTAIALIIGAISEMAGLYYYEMTGFFSISVAWIHATVRAAVAAMLLFLQGRIRPSTDC